MFLIGHLAKQTGLNVSTIRYYEKRGLIQPAYQNIENSYHYYDNNTIMQIIWITGLKSLGFTLKEIRSFLETNDEKHLILLLKMKQKELAREIAEAENKLQLISKYLTYEEN